MSTSLDHLLPAPDDTVRCAEYARSIDVDCGGTAIRADRVILVATPPPWPKPALAHPLLAALADDLRAGPTPTRLLAAVARPDQPGLVVVYDRAGSSAVERRYHLDLDQPVEALQAQLRSIGASGLGGEPAGSPTPDASHDPARAAVLICTQGSHDVCCGSEGARFAEQVEAMAAEPDGPMAGLDVFRVSHTGGHRFAPTAMTLPDGRMWAGLSMTTLAAIVAEQGHGAELVDRCRGWWGADTGPAQLAERAVFSRLGWAANHRVRSVEVATDASQGRVSATVAAGDDRWVVELAVEREVPTIACRQPGGLPAKRAVEYRVVSVSA